MEEPQQQLLKLSDDGLFDMQAKRALAHVQFGGADFGECLVTMQRIPPGDKAAWHREWMATADRVAAIGDACAKSGHRVSAREAWLRASNYYRTSWLMLFGAPASAALLTALRPFWPVRCSCSGCSIGSMRCCRLDGERAPLLSFVKQVAQAHTESLHRLPTPTSFDL